MRRRPPGRGPLPTSLRRCPYRQGRRVGRPDVPLPPRHERGCHPPRGCDRGRTPSASPRSPGRDADGCAGFIQDPPDFRCGLPCLVSIARLNRVFPAAEIYCQVGLALDVHVDRPLGDEPLERRQVRALRDWSAAWSSSRVKAGRAAGSICRIACRSAATVAGGWGDERLPGGGGGHGYSYGRDSDPKRQRIGRERSPTARMSEAEAIRRAARTGARRERRSVAGGTTSDAAEPPSTPRAPRPSRARPSFSQWVMRRPPALRRSTCPWLPGLEGPRRAGLPQFVPNGSSSLTPVPPIPQYPAVFWV